MGWCRRTGISMTFVSGLLVGAHFLRAGSYPLVALSVLFPFLLFVAKSWAWFAVQAALVVSTGVWLRTLYHIARWRMAMGAPWERMACILGAVALLTFAAAILIHCERRKMNCKFRPEAGK